MNYTKVHYKGNSNHLAKREIMAKYQFVITKLSIHLVEKKTQNWLKTPKCKLIKSDGTKPIDYNVNYIRTQL